MITESVDREIQAFRTATAEFVAKEILPHELAIGQTGVVPDSVLRHLRELGYYGLAIPEEYGGVGLSHLAYCVVLEELSKSPKPVWLPLVVANGILAQAIRTSGTEAQKQRYLPPLAEGRWTGSLAVTEPDAGSDVQGIRTRGEPAEGGWRLSGTKQFITLGHRAEFLIVLARTGDEDGKRRFTAFIVERGSPGFSVARVQETMAGPPAEHAELIFDDCFVPDELVLGRPGAGLTAVFKTFDAERISMAVTALGTAGRALELAVDYALDRQAFGRAIGDFQAVQIHLADIATELHAARTMTYDAARRLDAGEVISTEAAMVKLFTTEMAGRAADRALQVFGGIGYTTDSVISRIYRDVRVMRIAGGTSEIQRGIIAQALLEQRRSM